MTIRAGLTSFGLALAFAVPGCFDAEEVTEGLRCTQSSHCGGSLECIGGICAHPDDCDPSRGACEPSPTGSGDGGVDGATNASPITASASMTAAADDSSMCAPNFSPCDTNGGPCCDGTCVAFDESTLLCQPLCNTGADCPDTCCCVQLADQSGNACVDTSYCGVEAYCNSGSSCGSPGSACVDHSDCCNGGRCTLNAGGWRSCFRPCDGPTDCASGCCNYNGDFASYVCEPC